MPGTCYTCGAELPTPAMTRDGEMRNAKVDANHPQIVKELRDRGATVQSLAKVGGGCPDLLVGFGNRNVLLEIKDGEKCPSRIKLTAAEANFAENWKGQYAVVKSAAEAVRVVFG